MKIPYFFFLESYLEKTKHDIVTGLKTIDSIACVLGLTGTILCLIEHEIYIADALDYQEIVDSAGKTEQVILHIYEHNEPTESTILRTAITITTLLTIIAVLKRYMIRWKYLTLKAALDIRTKARKTLHFWFCSIEILFLLIHAPPKVNFVISWDEQQDHITYPFDTIVSIFMLGRVYLIWRVFQNFTFWNSPSSNQIKETFGCSIKARFALKAEMKFRPYQLIMWVVIGSVIVLGFALRNAEIVFIAVSRLDWYPFYNAMWCIAMSMTAVGYGDYYPTSDIGRMTILVAALWGNFLTSIFVVALTNSIEFTFNQNQSYQMVKRGQKEIVLATKAANLLKFALLLWIRNGKKVNGMKKSSGIASTLFVPGILSRKRAHKSIDALKKLFIQSAIEFKKYRRDHEAFLNEVSTDSVYREVKAVLLKDLTYLKTKLPLYSNINKRIIENELFQILIQEKIEFLAKTQKSVFKKLGNSKPSGVGFPTFENHNYGKEDIQNELDIALNPLKKAPNTDAFGLEEKLDDFEIPIDSILNKIPEFKKENSTPQGQKGNRENWRGLKRFSVDHSSLIEQSRKLNMSLRLQGIKAGRRVYKTPTTGTPTHQEDGPTNQEETNHNIIQGINQIRFKRKKVGSAIMDQRKKTIIKEAPLRDLIPGLAELPQSKEISTPVYQNHHEANGKQRIKTEFAKLTFISTTTTTITTLDKQKAYINPIPTKNMQGPSGSSWKPLALSQSKKKLASISEVSMVRNIVENREFDLFDRDMTKSESSGLLNETEALIVHKQSSEISNTSRSVSDSQSGSLKE